MIILQKNNAGSNNDMLLLINSLNNEELGLEEHVFVIIFHKKN